MSRRAFSVADVMAAADLPGVDLSWPRRRVTKYELIAACEKVQIGAVQDRHFSAGVATLANWIVRNRHRDLGAIPPFDDGERIERILAGVDIPDDETVAALQRAMCENPSTQAWADRGYPMVSAQSFSAMPPSQGSSAARGPHAGGGASPPDRFAPSHDPAAALPAMGALGGPLPSGPICFATPAGGADALFILTFSAGVAVVLDETTGVAARRAIDDGLARLRAARAAVTGEAA